jgi:hypothetical protein
MNERELIEQLCKDLNSAHDELMMAQGATLSEARLLDWLEWTPQANSIRAAELLLCKRLAKTKQWSLYKQEG